MSLAIRLSLAAVLLYSGSLGAAVVSPERPNGTPVTLFDFAKLPAR